MEVSTLAHLSVFGKLGMVVGLLPLVAGILYAIRPDERRLALMRPLSLAGIFAAVSNLLLGVANSLHALANVDAAAPRAYQNAGTWMAEAIIPSFIGFAFLTVAWLCVAVAIRRSA